MRHAGLVRLFATSSSAHERSAAAAVLSESMHVQDVRLEEEKLKEKLRGAQRQQGAGAGGGGQPSSSSSSSVQQQQQQQQQQQPGTDRFGERLRTLFRRSSFPVEKSVAANEQLLRQRVKVRQYEHGMVSEHPQQNQDTYFLPIRAFHLGRRIDFRRLAERYPHLPHAMQRDCLILDLTNRTSLGVQDIAAAAAAAAAQRPRQSIKEEDDAATDAASSTTAVPSNPLHGDDDGETSATIDDVSTMVEAHSMLRPSYAVVYRYGSIVFFNVPDDDVRDRARDEQRLPARSDGGIGAVGQGPPTSSTPLSMAAATTGVVGSTSSSLSFQGELIHTTKAFVSGIKFPHCAEEYGVQVGSRDAEEDSWASISGDHVAVKSFDLNSVRVIGSVLGQSVALDHYANDVDRMLQIFTQLNEDMEKTGTFSMKKERLFQLVATNNTTLTDLVNNLKLLDRSDTAWKYERYSDLWDELRKEFELEDRFETLEYKLNLVQHNVKFFLEILQNRKSDTLEWIIIILISGEILVSLYDIGSRLPGT